jgi:hypothetical protein
MKTDIHGLNTFSTILSQYFTAIKSSDVFDKIENKNEIIFSGFNTLLNVFNYAIKVLQKTDEALLYMQQAQYFYVEYIEQIYNTNLSYALNQNDAVIFTYKKTVFDLYANGSTFEMLDSNEHIFVKTVKTLMFWENHDFILENHEYICNYYVPKYLKYDLKLISNVIGCISLLKQNFKFTYNEYIELLESSLQQLHPTKMCDDIDNDMLILKFYSYKEDFNTMLKKQNFTKIFNIMYNEITI